MQTIFKSATVEALFDREAQMICITYFGTLTKSEDFRTATVRAGEFAVQHKIVKWLIDQRNMNVHPNDHAWFYNEWQPAFEKAMPGGRKVALIPAKNLFSEYAVKMENLRLIKSGNTNIQYFNNCEDAREWLLTVC